MSVYWMSCTSRKRREWSPGGHLLSSSVWERSVFLAELFVLLQIFDMTGNFQSGTHWFHSFWWNDFFDRTKLCQTKRCVSISTRSLSIISRKTKTKSFHCKHVCQAAFPQTVKTWRESKQLGLVLLNLGRTMGMLTHSSSFIYPFQGVTLCWLSVCLPLAKIYFMSIEQMVWNTQPDPPCNGNQLQTY